MNCPNSSLDDIASTDTGKNNDIDIDPCEICRDVAKFNDYLKKRQESLEMQFLNVDEKFERQGTKLLRKMYEDDMFKAEQLQYGDLEKALSRQRQSLHNKLEETAQAMESDEQNLKFQIEETREVMSECLGSIPSSTGTGDQYKHQIKDVVEQILKHREEKSILELQKKELENKNTEADALVSDSLTSLKDQDANTAINILKTESNRLRRVLVDQMKKNTSLMTLSQEQRKEKNVRPGG